jgi:RHS repeat-associated protein
LPKRSPFTLKYESAGGILRSVREVSGPEFWSLNGPSPLNAFGAITGERFGNGVVRARDFDPVTGWLEKITAGPLGNETALQNAGVLYDAVGNVQQRQNNLGSLPEPLNEDFTNSNDALYRFRTGSVNGAVTLDIQEYDDLGNIRRKSDNSGVEAPVDYTVTWTSYNYPASIDSPTMKEKVSFAYGPNRSRWRMVYQDTATNRLETTYYLGAMMEKVITTEGTTTSTEYRHYIHAGSTPVAIHSRVVGGANATRYMLADHLGSIDTIADGAGTKLVNSSYTPYGLARDPVDWRGAPANLHSEYTRQGYTFQTVLGRLGLNHMNGRVQDAITGQFLSPDPLVTRPDDTQSWNRYAYVQNNPLTFIDPSGWARWCSIDYSPIGLVWERINGEWIETMQVDSGICHEVPDPLDYTQIAWEPNFSNDDPGAGGVAPEVFLPTPELNVDKVTECQIFADSVVEPKRPDAVDIGSDVADGTDAGASALAAQAAESAAKQSYAAQVGAAAAVNEGTYRPTPGVAHQGLTALGEARATAWILRGLANFAGIGGAILDGISSAQHFMEGNEFEGSIDAMTAGSGALAVRNPQAAPLAGYIWGMGKLYKPRAHAYAYYQCMGVDLSAPSEW